MGRRAARHRFVPDHYVFPGGRLDAADYRAKAKTRLRPEVEKQLCSHCSPALAHALAVAAVRETFEETGLVLGEVNGDVLKPKLDRLRYVLRAITPASSPVRFHARFFAVEATELGGNGELLDLGWRPVEECLRLPIVDVTEYLLRKLAAGGDFIPRAGSVPLFAFRKDRAFVR